MSVSVTHFESLRQRFPEFAELRAHLESVEGGSLRCVESEAPYVVFRYTKDKTAATGVFRSVVWDTVKNVPVCVAPFRANEGMPPVNVQLSATEDFVDGFMMNAWVGSDGVLHVATRTQIDGDNKFYSDKTFGEMFDECLTASPLKTREALCQELTVLRNDSTAASAFASFVLQHPEHRVVAKIQNPFLYLVHLGTVSSSGRVDISERATNWPQKFGRLQVPSYPVRKFQSEQEIDDLLRRTSVQRGWRWQGLVFKDGQGRRWRLRTPTYTMMRELRGAEAGDMERFFRLRASRKVMDYLKHYSEERDAMWAYEQTLRARTADIMAAYADVHKAHAVAFKDLPEAYKPAVFMLHMKWRNELREKGFKVRVQNAIEVVNGMRDFEKRRLMEATPYVAVSPTQDVVSEEQPESAETTA